MGLTSLTLLFGILLVNAVLVQPAPTDDNSRYDDYLVALQADKAEVVDGSRREKGYEYALDDFGDIERATENENVTDNSLIEGDIRVPTAEEVAQMMDKLGRKVISERGGTRWKNKVIPWRIERNQYQANDVNYVRQEVKSALAVWESRSCVRFPEVSSPEQAGVDKMIKIINGQGCYSYVGAYFRDQSLSLQMQGRGWGCVSKGVILHEFGHAAGFYHEQSRADRDNEIRVYYGNIYSGREGNFKKSARGGMDNYTSAPYDVSSVMHYSLMGFSTGAKTISMLKPGLDTLAGHRGEPSYYDEVAMNKAYDCAEGCRETCKNHGYVRRMGSSCKCFCPPYLGGYDCNQVTTTCGGVYSLQSGQSRVISSRSYPSNYVREDCAYLFTAPPNHYLRLTFNDFSLPTSCRHYLDIRNNAIGQQSPYSLCGSGQVEDVTTFSAIQKDKMLAVFSGSDAGESPRGRYRFTVTAVADACVNDPCHGAPCISEGARVYRCQYPQHPIHCKFEQGFIGDCSAMRVNKYYENVRIDGRSWDIGKHTQTSNTDGKFYSQSASDSSSSSSQSGTISIMPTLVGGTSWCLDFQYTVTGRSGRLNVYKAVNGQKGSPIFTTTSGGWTRKLIEIDGRRNSQRDMIEVVFESVGFGEAGIDDIKYRPGKCPSLSSPCARYPCGTHQCVERGSRYECIRPTGDLKCSFELEDSECSVLVDYQVSGDNFDPIVNSGTTPTKGTGPSSGHTGNSYIYFEAYKRSPGQTSQIRILPLSSGLKRLSFWYHAYGYDSGKLSVYLLRNKARSLLGTAFSGNNGNVWKKYESSVIDTTRYSSTDTIELLLEYTITRSSTGGDVAIDDIEIDDLRSTLVPATTPETNKITTENTPKTTEKSVTQPTEKPVILTTTTPTPTQSPGNQAIYCSDFEGKIENYGTNDKSNNGGVFKINSGSSPWSLGSPPYGVTKFTGANWAFNGAKYLLYDAAYSSAKTGDVSRYSLKPFTSSQGACLTFWYIKYGKDWGSGSFNVLTKYGGITSRVKYQGQDKDDYWKKAQITLPATSSPLTVTFEVVRGGVGNAHDLAIDNVNVAIGRCNEDSATVCGSGKDKKSFSCGFEPGDSCGWLDRRVPSYLMPAVVAYGGMKSDSGMSNDNDCYSKPYDGLFYLKFPPSDPRSKSSAVVVDSYPGAATRCLKFFYLKSKFAGARIQIRASSGSTRVLSTPRPNKNGWTQVVVQLSMATENSKITITSQALSSGYVALDNITYRDGPC